MRKLLKYLNKRKSLLLGIFAGSMLFATPALAGTLYVNPDSNGTAANPTRAFNDPSYVPDDSYHTFVAAYFASQNGDTIELSGGSNGESYQGYDFSLQKSITIRGSRIAGFNGPVKITRNPTSTYAVGLNADDMTLDNLIISGSDLGRALTVWKNNAYVKNTIIQDPGSNTYPLYVLTGPGSSTNKFENVVVKGSIKQPLYGSLGIYIDSTGSTTVNFYNSDIVGVPGRVVKVFGGATVNFINSVFAANHMVDTVLLNFSDQGGQVNFDHSAIMNAINSPHLYRVTGTGTYAEVENLMNVFPIFRQSPESFGFIGLSTDDFQNLDYFISNANYAMDNYGIPLTFYASYTHLLTSTQKQKLQTLYKQGHEIGAHTRHHTSLAILNALNIKYSGGAPDMTVSVASSGTRFTVTSSVPADNYGPIDLTNPTTDNLGELCALVRSWPNFSCEKFNAEQISDYVLAKGLKDATLALPVATTTSLPFDDDTGPGNRFYSDEITGSINDLESAIHEDPAAAGYVAKTLALPFNAASTQVLSWIRANTNLIGVRSNNDYDIKREQGWLGNIDVFNSYLHPSITQMKGPGYDSLTLADKKSRIEAAARTMASLASGGFFAGFLSHDDLELTSQEWRWALDELVKYRDAYRLNINSFANLIEIIRTSGDWTNAGNGIWTRTMPELDLRLATSSALVDAGVAVPGRTTDILGNPIVGAPDIGAYEFGSQPTTTTPPPADGTAPSIPGTPTTTPSITSTPTWSWTGSTDTESGLAQYIFEWSTDASFGPGIFSASTTNNFFTHSAPLADGTWYARAMATDIVGNQSAYSGIGSILIDTSSSTPTTTPDTTPTSTPTSTPVTPPSGGGSSGGGGSGGNWARITYAVGDWWYSNPAPGYGILINGSNTSTSNRKVKLHLYGGDTKYMTLSNTSNFAGRSSEPFATERDWDLCDGLNSCGSGPHIVYVKFYKNSGNNPPLLSNSIFLSLQNSAPTVRSNNAIERSPAPKATQQKTVLGTKILNLGKNLLPGSRGKDVKALQDYLKSLGLFPKNIASTGFYGRITAASVKQFQRGRGIKATGNVDTGTRRALGRTK